MNVKLVVYTLLFFVTWQITSGLWTLLNNLNPLPFDFHRYGAAATLIILVFKGGVIYRSLRTQFTHRYIRRSTYLSLFLLCELVALLLLALLWFFNAVPTFIVSSITPLDLHIWIALALVPALAIHVAQRAHAPRNRGSLGRREALKVLAIGAGAVLLWQLSMLGSALTNPPQTRRFTGSRNLGSCSSCFPATTWFFDSSPIIDVDHWTLTVRGKVDQVLILNYNQIAQRTAITTAFLDCTGGWYSYLTWQGIEVSQLLAQAGVKKDATQILFSSVTGHNTKLPLDEGKRALLATHVQGEVLNPEHGYPLRLIAPDRRGFQWIKWLDSIEVI